ncbi:hypothetical protein P3S67_008010 [Capsicum chacoense]
MESRMNQSENKSSTTNEESGWTTYLEDFSLMNNYQSDQNYRSSSCCDDDNFGSHYSLLSDAASNIAPWKNNNYCNTNYNDQLVENDECSPKKLNLMKLPRNKKINDPDLEDTASSPVNSPKVSNFRQMEINYRRKENSSGNFLGSEGCSRQLQEMQKVERENNGYTDLKKKGHCLVPISMFINYHG